ncbi:hypothetical protein H5410_056545 [Solanum commersonii]|uniref:Uncharacterized protein n=1 Tax=Solanum commersonii TaxID=4109 RepID=A0A9J5WKJ5_SOLCO|nr:hypothetical protein H5410_056545 [Solanum commersonii]
MELIRPDSQINPFSRSNVPRVSKPLVLPIFVYYNIGQDLSFGVGWSRWVNRPIFKVKLSPERVNPIFCRFLCASPWIVWSSIFSTSFLPKVFVEVRPDLNYGSMDPLVIWISDVIFAKKFHGRPSRPQLWSRLIPMGKPTHFQG